jgi:hypothetical protein
MKKIWDFFDREMGSKVWPSDDPKDSPFDRFRCRCCGEVLSIQMWGSAPAMNSFEDQASKLLCEHLINCSEFSPVGVRSEGR